MEGVGAKLLKLRTELNLTQKEFAQVIQVDSGTYSKWERGDKIPGGPNKPKAEYLLEIEQDEKLKEVIKKTLASDGGIPATAGLLGLLFAVLSTYGVSVKHLWPQLTGDSVLLDGVYKLTQKADSMKGG